MSAVSAVPTVARDGSVSLSGSPIGCVRKQPKETIASSLLGTPSTQSEWVPLDLEGKAIAGPQSTRKRAVSILEMYARPDAFEDPKWEEYGGQRYLVGHLRVRGNGLGMSWREGHVDDSGRRVWAVHSIWELGAFLPRYCTMPGSGGYALEDPEMRTLVDEAADAFIAKREQ
jgi:hypothetical protein